MGNKWVVLYDTSHVIRWDEEVRTIEQYAYDEFEIQTGHLRDLEAAGFTGRAEDADKMKLIDKGTKRWAITMPHLGESAEELWGQWVDRGKQEDNRPIPTDQLIQLFTTVLNGEYILGDCYIGNLVYDPVKGPCFIDVSPSHFRTRDQMVRHFFKISKQFSIPYSALPEEMQDILWRLGLVD